MLLEELGSWGGHALHGSTVILVWHPQAVEPQQWEVAAEDDGEETIQQDAAAAQLSAHAVKDRLGRVKA